MVNLKNHPKHIWLTSLTRVYFCGIMNLAVLWIIFCRLHKVATSYIANYVHALISFAFCYSKLNKMHTFML